MFAPTRLTRSVSEGIRISLGTPSLTLGVSASNAEKTNMESQTPTQKPPQLPSDTVRGLVSLFLIIHLFALTVSLAAYVSASLVQRQLVIAMGPYLRTFNFELTHAFPAVARLHLTHANPTDVDFRVSGTVKLPDGKSQTWEIPRTRLFPPTRYRRDQTLANVVGGLTESENESQESLLPRALAAAELKKAGARKGEVTVTAHYLQEITDLKASETKLRDPFDASYYRPVFAADVLANAAGVVSLLKSTAKGEVAPVTGAGGNTSKSTPQKQP